MSAIDLLCYDVCTIIAEYATSEVCVTAIEHVMNENRTQCLPMEIPLTYKNHRFTQFHLVVSTGSKLGHGRLYFKISQIIDIVSPVQTGFFRIGKSLYYHYDGSFENRIYLIDTVLRGLAYMTFHTKPNGKHSKQILARLRFG